MRIVSVGSMDGGNVCVKALGSSGCTKKITGAGDFGFGFGEERVKIEHDAIAGCSH